MSEASVRAWFAANAPDIAIIDQGVSTATVLEAAQALGVEPARIAKTLSLRVGDTVALVCTRGDARLHNAKAKAALGAKPRMLGADEVEAVTGHPVGGVCPFGLAAPLPVYCDVSLKAFATVFPAAGSRTSSVELTPARLALLTDATWIDICTLPETVE
ncbi:MULTISPECIES: YbaK/EbsC family protein [unclassified Sphingobium]|uniref:YbaK/EbsC family protein n=1 Tax=unclassified Sphingobium TaxID=2611147 RepID=UPI000D176D56|nr:MULTISPECIES: YbaK/EbsC family protein [unclassified Sphingobium]MBG6119614.1 prolyl-tRNA editing enzyme YbaK/EbsC (Cys-tRNA(Pro) deacylase) [Sphingobium sp. JAI105]PSO13300.1 cys-tRNA(pro)/cys-tRNA(cys) deacylase [Sphingobium sp. AEW4]TWD11534.1 prolyl-tRNA editing enzyme YbaK/EbsC (Cys-tRNA(Pro) deacylase) [Sphingobium sp. AEW010]TWD28575.1 prolyl-tRNA editing enzyme YbaK/EbsC (Cys-tRNA(Pro) deacylase) [Sphingobium sp. AEW013]TWD30076.1 prolyl-tRNA editing enzyme YbaK/EbsC (Cys-tRNA(Pro) 